MAQLIINVPDEVLEKLKNTSVVFYDYEGDVSKALESEIMASVPDFIDHMGWDDY